MFRLDGVDDVSVNKSGPRAFRYILVDMIFM